MRRDSVIVMWWSDDEIEREIRRNKDQITCKIIGADRQNIVEKEIIGSF